MIRFTRALLAVLHVTTLLGGVVTATGCGAPEQPASCGQNADCEADEICVAGLCRAPGEEGEGEGEGEGEEPLGPIVFETPAFAPADADLVLSWTAPGRTCSAFVGTTPLVSLSATSAVLQLRIAAAVVVELRCDGEAPVSRTIQLWRTSGHAVASDGITTWQVDPAGLATECVWEVDPRGIGAGATTVTTVESGSLGPFGESTDVRLTACRLTEQPVPPEPQTGTFAIVVEPSVVAYEVDDVDEATGTVTFAVTATGADRCSVAGSETVRSGPDEGRYLVTVVGTDLLFGQRVVAAASCRLGTEAPVASSNTIDIFRGDITLANHEQFVSGGPVVMFGTVVFREIDPVPFITLNAIHFLVGAVRIENVNSEVCGPESIFTVSLGQAKVITGRIDAINVFKTNSTFCPGGFALAFAALQEARGGFVVNHVGLERLLVSNVLMTASIDVDDVAGSLNFNALEDVVGALSVSGSDSLTSFSANALRSISGDVFLSSMDTIDSLRFPSLVSIGGTLDVTLEFLDELEFASLVDVDRVLIENNIRLTRLVFSSLAQVGSGDVGDTFTLRNSASALAAGDTFRVLMPATPAIVDGTIVITDNRRITAEAALAVAAKLDNSASGFAAPTVTNNRP